MYSNVIPSVLAAILVGVANAQTTTDPVTGTLGNATIPENNPVVPIYVATLPETQFFNPSDPRGNVKGSVSAKANPDGIGIQFNVGFSNLPTSGGPFSYHIHAHPVPTDGNCTGTLAHLDPFLRGEVPACDPSLPQTCQVGDLAGKHGKISSDPFQTAYVDEFTSTLPTSGSFFGNLSVTVHFANKTRITCANFTSLDGPAASSNEGYSNTTSNGLNGTSTGVPATYTGSSTRRLARGGMIAAVGVPIAFAL
ncbi:Cell surface superoxide dismutase [Cu-Zn] 4 [Ciborinia camelliae]|nr:Cell surface superoxide dismutase [Cu-Zn] 4 [Ciborinia camelliae]